MKRIPLILATAAVALSMSRAALADPLSLVLSGSSYNVNPGGSVTVSGTITSLQSSVTEYLNGDSFVVSGPVALDDTLFVENAPLSLAPGESYAGALFTLTALPQGNLGSFAGSFTLLGGPSNNSMDSLASAHFSAGVTPEPGTLLLVCSGVFAGWLLWRRQRPVETVTSVI